MTAADEKNEKGEKSEKSEMMMTAPVVPAGGTQSLAGSETYDSYANSQMGRLTRIVAVHAGVSQPSTSQMLAERLAEGVRRALAAGSRPADVEIMGLRPPAGPKKARPDRVVWRGLNGRRRSASVRAPRRAHAPSR